MKKADVIILLVWVISTFVSVPAFAATKIPNVKIHIGIEDYDEYGDPIFEAEAKSDHYEISDITLVNGFSIATGPAVEIAGEEKQALDQDIICEIELYSDDEHYFGTMGQKNIKLSGIDSVCTQAVRKDNGSTLLLTIHVTGIDQMVGTIDYANFSAEGTAEWGTANNAAVYHVTLYKDNKKIGKMHSTGTSSFHFTPLMREPGTYFYKVYPSSHTEKKGAVVESASITIKPKTAEETAGIYSVEPGWKNEGRGWRYQESDGCYMAANWLNQDGRWYYFSADGYMMQNTWINWKRKLYYLGDTGAMLVNTVTPDGYRVDDSGQAIEKVGV